MLKVWVGGALTPVVPHHLRPQYGRRQTSSGMAKVADHEPTALTTGAIGLVVTEGCRQCSLLCLYR